MTESSEASQPSKPSNAASIAPSIAPLIPAATVVMLRDGFHQDGTGRLEVLLLQRNAARGAFAGLWVFPGGRVDDTDADDVGCAVRESVEETGVVLDPKTLVRLSHWTPPVTEPKRFGTWFFVAPVSSDMTVIVDDAEIVGHQWLSIAEALDQRDTGAIGLAPPTFVTLASLSRFGSVADVLAYAAAKEPDLYVTTLVKEGGVLAVVWPPDAALQSGGTLETEGDRHRLVLNHGGWVYDRAGEWASEPASEWTGQ